MNFFILDAQINFYIENGYIEFENFFSEEKMQMLENELNLYISSDKSLSPIEQYKKQRDLFRKSIFIKDKIALDKNLLNAAKALSNKDPLRLVYDQLLFGSTSPFEVFKMPASKMLSINDISSFQNLILAAIIKVDSIESSISSLPKKRSSVMFLKSNSLIDFESIYSNSYKLFLIVFGNQNTIYVYNKKDPNCNYLKEFDYNFSDTLKDKFHPLVF